MANDATHYRELAARARIEAGEATLDNVRDRALRSAAVFETMALELDGTAKRRAEREASIDNPAPGASVDVSPYVEFHKEQT
jgi:hypothetical protein